MKTQVRKRYTLLASVLLVVSGLVLACFLWVRAAQRHYAMNRELIASLANGDFKRALNLVEAGADPNTPVVPSPPPSWQELLQQLLHRSPLPTNNGPTAFMVTCGYGRSFDGYPHLPENHLHDPQLLLLAQMMLLCGANVNATDKIGSTALMAASSEGLIDRMALLLKHGALIDHQNFMACCALHYAVYGNHPASVKLLLKYHANLNLKDWTHNTPLTSALLDLKSSEMVRLLKAAEATK